MKLPEKIQGEIFKMGDLENMQMTVEASTINQIIDYLEEREQPKVLGFSPSAITIKKPKWWEKHHINGTYETEAKRRDYLEALADCERVSGIKFTLGD